MEVSGQLHAPTTLFRGKTPRYPLHRTLGEPREILYITDNRNMSWLYWVLNPDSSIVQPVT
jgi:hypothetical protein